MSPAVVHLIKTRGISDSETANIPRTGPKGRLLKGDVLSYLSSAKESDKPSSEVLGFQNSEFFWRNVKSQQFINHHEISIDGKYPVINVVKEDSL